MDLDTLRTRIQPVLTQDFDAVWEGWVQESGSDDPAQFVAHLMQWRLIPAALGEDLLPDVDLTDDPTEMAEPPEAEAPEALFDEDLDPADLDPTEVGEPRQRPEAPRRGDPVASRRVAVRGPASDADGAVLRYRREIHILAQLDHPGVPALLAVRSPTEAAFRPFDGPTLADVVAEVRGTLAAGHSVPSERSLAHLLDRFVQVCETVGYAASRGVAHTNLHPAAIVLGGHGATWVTDWGLARVFNRNVALPVDVEEPPTAIPLVPGYGAPEQVAGPEPTVDARSDVYALGLLLYEILALTPAIPGDSSADRFANQRAGVVRPLQHAFGQPIDAGLAAVTATALARAPTDRFAHAAALAGAVRRARGSSALPSPRPVDRTVPLLLAGIGWALTLVAWLGWVLFG